MSWWLPVAACAGQVTSCDAMGLQLLAHFWCMFEPDWATPWLVKRKVPAKQGSCPTKTQLCSRCH